MDLWRKQTIYNTSQVDGIMMAYQKAYPSSKAGQKAAPVSVGCVYVIDLPSGGNLTHTLMPDNRE